MTEKKMVFSQGLCVYQDSPERRSQIAHGVARFRNEGGGLYVQRTVLSPHGRR